MRVVLLSTYELGRQPFGLASPAAWLRAAGHEVTVADLSCSHMPVQAVGQAEMLAFFLPMHTATRLFLRLIDRIRAANPRARLCAYGLYAPLNEAILRRVGVDTILGGEFEAGLVRAAGGDTANVANGANGFTRGVHISLDRQQFLVPDRTGLPPLGAYAQLVAADGVTRRVGYTEASRGCKHLCRHCPVVPVYQGVFRIVQPDVVLEDIRRQVAAGAEHITFGDPDFFNGPGHAMPIVEALHREWPALTYDVTIKVEHLLRHRNLLPALHETGCLFVTSAVESLDDAVLARLAKGHTRADFEEALALMRQADLPLAPTFIPFTPWTTAQSYRDFLRALLDLDLAGQVAPIQLAIRLLIPEGSLLFDLPEVRSRIQPFDPRGLCYPWRNPGMDELCATIQEPIKQAERRRVARLEIFRKIWDLAEAGEWPVDAPMESRATIPYLTEPWYC
ncbi:MAG TPA: CUAEP/CCAEP-tail radical SAM protein [Candidatus Sulfopaludibacter sp.]|nr:CUAEP/CCAEP-tail radical SAM protein [Candidatus Sulfopaludibacter sp.]